MNQAQIRNYCFWLVLLAAMTLLLVGLIITDVWPGLRGPAPGTSEWYWPYWRHPAGRWWPVLLAAAAVLGLAAWWFRAAPDDRRRDRWALAGLVVAAFGLQVALVYAARPGVQAELVDRALSVRASGYFWTAANIEELGGTLRNYPAAMPQFESEHAQTHPPGLVAANWLTIAGLARLPGLAEPLAALVWPLRCIDLWLLNQPAAVPAALWVWAWLPLVVGALAGLPGYALARQLFPPPAARVAAVVVATLPGLLLFAPQSDQFFVPLTLTTVWALHVGLARRSAGWLGAAGLLLSLSSFLTLGNAALLVVLLAYGLGYWAVGLGGWPRPGEGLRWLLAFGLGAAAFWLGYWLGWGVPPWAVAQAGLAAHYTLVTSQRNYGWWLAYNLVDLLTFVGLPVVAGFLVAIVGGARRPGRRTAAWVLAVAVLLLLLLLDLSGSTRGEVGRLWLFFTPLIGLLGAGYLAGWFPGRGAHLLIVGLQLLILLSVGLFWRPFQAVIVVAQPPVMAAPPAGVIPVGAQFGEQITLQGYHLAGPADGALYLTLQWQAAGPTLRPYTVFNHLVDSAGQVVAQKDDWPVNGQWPPTCWRAGDVIIDSYRIELPPGLPAGRYQLYTGLYDAASLTRLTTPAGEDAVWLQAIELP